MKTGLPKIDTEKCAGCGDCVEECPTGAVELAEGKAIIARPEDCNYCTDCESVCSHEAIRCFFEVILAEEKR